MGNGGRLTLQEAADALGVHYMTAYRYVRLGLLPAEKSGATWQVERRHLDAMRQGGNQGVGRRTPAPWAARLEARLIAGDDAGSWGVVEAALAAGAEPAAVLVDVLTPALRAVGDRWVAGDIDVADEHRATVVAGRLLGRLAPRFNRRGRSKGIVVLGAVEGERHALPVTIVADAVRGGGWEVVDLGADVPHAYFARIVAAQERLVAVGVSVSADVNRAAVPAAVAAIKATTPAPVLVGGGAVLSEGDAIELGGDGWAPDARAAAELLVSFVPVA